MPTVVAPTACPPRRPTPHLAASPARPEGRASIRERPAGRPIRRCSAFDKVPYEEVLATLEDTHASVRERVIALLKLWTRYRYCYLTRSTAEGVACAGVVAPSQRAIARILGVHEASVGRTITRLITQGKLHRSEDLHLGHVLSLRPLTPEAWLWDPHTLLAFPFTPTAAEEAPPSPQTPDQPETGKPLTALVEVGEVTCAHVELACAQVSLACTQVSLACVCMSSASPIKDRARDPDPTSDPCFRPDLTSGVEVVSAPPSASPSHGPDDAAAGAPAAPRSAQEAPRPPRQGATPRVWVDPSWSLPEALAALELPQDAEVLPSHAQVRPEDILDAFTSQGQRPLPLHDLAPLLAQLLTVEQLRCIDSNLKRALRRGDLRDPRAYVLQAARAILDGTSYTAPPRHACTSLRPPGGEAGHAAPRSDEVVGSAQPPQAPGMDELRRWRDGLDEATRRDFEARCYLLRSELEAHYGAVVEGGKEAREEAVWRAAWAEVGRER